MEDSHRTLIEQANNLSASAMALGIASEKLVHEALECADFLRYVIGLVQHDKIDEALYHLRNGAGQGADSYGSKLQKE